MKKNGFNLSTSLFNKIFPFYILLNEHLQIISFGKNIPKIITGLTEGTPFDSIFTIVRPHVDNITPENFHKNTDHLIVITTKDSDKVTLRGQFEKLDNNFLFIGSPWFNSMNEVTDKNLTLNDFAYHDPILDILHISKNQEINYKELKELLETVNEQRKTLKKDKEELNKLSLVASANKNGVVLFTPGGKILWCNNAYLKIVSLTNEEVIGQFILDFGPCKITEEDKIKEVLRGFEEGKIFEGEKATLIKDRKTFWYKTTKQPVRDEAGQIIHYFAIIEDVTLEKEQEEKLRLLSSIAEKNTSAVIICDEKGRIEWINDSFTEITEYTLEEVIGKKIKKILEGPETDKKTVAYLGEQMKNGLPFNCDIINYKKSKNKYWSRVQGRALNDENGKVLKYFTIQEDISLEKEFKQQLIESENRLYSLIINLQSGILLEDVNRKILLVNKRFCDLFGIGLEPERMKGIDCSKAAEQSKFLFKNPDSFLARIDEILRQKSTVIAEEIEMVDGRIIQRSFIPIYRGNKYDGHLWSYDDVTIQKKYEQSLEAEREKYSNIITNMNMGLIEVDINDNIKFVNQSFSEMSGFSSEELIGVKAAELFLDPKSKQIIDTKTAVRAKGISDSYEIKVKIKSNEERYWLISGAPNYNLNGELVGSIGIHFDITEQKKLELQKEALLKSLEKQNESLNEYAQIVSHDLKSPLRSIHTLITWIKDEEKNMLSNQTNEYIALIEEKVEKMDYLIDGILTYSKIDSFEKTDELIDLNEIIDNIIQIIHIPKNTKVTIAHKLPVKKANRFRMQQLFQNLISNAIIHNDKKEGMVVIDYSENEEAYIFSVQDNGPGISEKYQSKIFHLFESYSPNNKSTGIGLSIVKKIVEKYNGKIWIESKVGIGTTFFIQLPKEYGTT
ncbi:PAS domain S-box protein [Flavobacterium sp. J49]|uniref:PAS domain-containing protein n=1 Tax=Flavobacterium sp. J49 TaxID=2718534 RepID=UPI001592E1F7|nr:PAS domain-containing protein [Flavobacterium sp. J49]MBF6642194.1 PAS domain S-box protein [Flavobacterium sp. J49]NIC03441.1 PAS domain S-box protein [Flavobacterium sp. J49]